MMFRTGANCYSINRLVQLLDRDISLLVDKFFKIRKKTNPQYKITYAIDSTNWSLDYFVAIHQIP